MSSRKDHTVTREDLAAAASACGLLSVKRSSKLVDDLLDLISEALLLGEPVGLSGFGKFDVIELRPRPARNVYHGRSMMLARRRKLRFRPSSKVVEMLNARR